MASHACRVKKPSAPEPGRGLKKPSKPMKLLLVGLPARLKVDLQ